MPENSMATKEGTAEIWMAGGQPPKLETSLVKYSGLLWISRKLLEIWPKSWEKNSDCITDFLTETTKKVSHPVKETIPKGILTRLLRLDFLPT